MELELEDSLFLIHMSFHVYDVFLPCSVVPAEIFLQVFSSDRMHMYNAVTKKWSAPPPTYACILPSPSNLVKYMTIDENDVQSRKGTTIEIGEDPFGTILSLVELKQLFGINSTTLQDK